MDFYRRSAHSAEVLLFGHRVTSLYYDRDRKTNKHILIHVMPFIIHGRLGRYVITALCRYVDNLTYYINIVAIFIPHSALWI